ncbi:MAG: P27 family phage terminase small subunit [Rubrivivax sp.]|nr:P27 family phage terminase small subunit [Rubrivivax sp.]
MGTRGPAPKPAELKLLEGGRGHRPLDLTQLFRPEVGVPDAPRWLMPEARKAWRFLSAELVRYNLLSKVDRYSFAMLCQAVGRIEQVERSIAARQALLRAEGRDEAEALFDTTPNGLRIQSAVYQVLNREQAKAWRMLDSFGLKPDARAKVQASIRAQLQLFPGGAGEAPAGDKPAAEGWDQF